MAKHNNDKYEGTIALAKYEARMRRPVTIGVVSDGMADELRLAFTEEELKLISFRRVEARRA